MRRVHFVACIAALLFCLTPTLHAQSFKLTVMGKLTRVMAMGAQTSVWAIDLNPVPTVHGKQVSSLEIKSSDLKKLEALEDKKVKVTGRLSKAFSLDSGQRPILTLSSIKAIKEKESPTDK